MISPELLTSLTVAGLPVATRYAFVALWMYLDDAGRGKDNADLVRAHTWPLDPSYTVRKVTVDLGRLAEAGLICRYQVNAVRYLHSPTWNEHQKINRPSDSKLPPCPDHDPDEWRAFTACSVSLHGGLTPNVIEVKGREENLSVVGPSMCEHGYHVEEAPTACAICRRGGLRAVGQ
jgi:hypothetical protein